METAGLIKPVDHPGGAEHEEVAVSEVAIRLAVEGVPKMFVIAGEQDFSKESR